MAGMGDTFEQRWPFQDWTVPDNAKAIDTPPDPNELAAARLARPYARANQARQGQNPLPEFAETPVGASKLELLSQRIWDRALKLGIDPIKFRDMVLRGEAHAGWLLGAPIGAGALGGAMGSTAATDQYH
jgi:hypothetical protein